MLEQLEAEGLSEGFEGVYTRNLVIFVESLWFLSSRMLC